MQKKVLLLFLFATAMLSGQNRPLLYGVDDLPQSLLQNPGDRIDYIKHFGIPFLSQVHVSAGSTGITVFDIFNDENAEVNARIRNALRTLTSGDYFSVNEQLEVISFGFRLGERGYVSAGAYQEADFFAYFPKDPALLAFEGNAAHLNESFDFSDVNFTVEMLVVYHLGYNFKVDSKLTVGGRFKLYSGIFNVESTNNSGTFRTEVSPDGPNFFRHFIDDFDILVNTSGYASLNGEDSTVDQAGLELLSRSFFGQNIGVGMDLGFTYKVTEQLTLSGSVQDFGVMFHQKDVENYQYKGTFQTDGIEPLFPELEPNESAFSYWDIFEEEVDRRLVDETLTDPYKTWRPLKYNASVEFGSGTAFLPCDYLIYTEPRFTNLFGLLFSGVSRPKGPTLGVTTYWDRKLTDNFRFRVSYGVDAFSLTKFGALVSKRFNNFNIYLAANDIIGFTNFANANSASLQFGMQFIFKEL